jgi:hypothetical protein
MPLDRFRRFYEGIVGLRLGALLRMDVPPHHRHAIFPIGAVATLHVFETPGSSQYPRTCPRTVLSALMGRIVRRTLACSSRMASGMVDEGASIAR